jgi:hypothetical protein
MENQPKKEKKEFLTNKQLADILFRHAAHNNGVITQEGVVQCRQASENIIKIYADSLKPVIIRRYISNVVIGNQNRTLNTANIISKYLLEENKKLNYEKFIFESEPIIEKDLSYGFEDEVAKEKMNQLMEKNFELKSIFNNDPYSIWESMGPLKILKEQTNTAQVVGKKLGKFIYNHLKEEFSSEFQNKYSGKNVLNLNFSHADLLDPLGKEMSIFLAGSNSNIKNCDLLLCKLYQGRINANYAPNHK